MAQQTLSLRNTLVGATLLSLVLLSTCKRASMCSGPNGMSDEVRQAFLDKHNEYRSLVAQGKAKNKSSGYAPMAARMLKMTYDCVIEQNVMKWLKYCEYKHNSHVARNNRGQNMWKSAMPDMNKTIAATWSVDTWFRELENIGAPDDNLFTMDVADSGLFHYTQLVWQSSERIGCGVEWCDEMTIVGCEYDPVGNILGFPIYDVGDSCSTHDDCQCSGCTCNKEEALCTTPMTKNK